MFIYTLNLLISTILNYVSRKIKNQKIAFFFSALAILIVSVVAGIRYGVGTDFFEYVVWFNIYSYGSISLTDSNIGFTIMIKIIQLFTDNSQWLFFICAIIINAGMMNFIKKNTDLYDLGFFLFITLYLYYSSLNIMRQWISIVIFLYALKYAFDKKLTKYVLTVLLSASFHSSAFLMLPLYFLLDLKVNIKNMLIVITSTFIVGIQFERIIFSIAKRVPFLNASSYIRYFDGRFAESGGGGWAYSIILILAFILMIIYKKSYAKFIQNADNHFVLMGIAIVSSLFSPINMIYSRIQLYLIPIVLVTLPNIIKIQRPKERILFYIIIVVFGLLYMYRSLLINGGQPLPYRTIFGR